MTSILPRDSSFVITGARIARTADSADDCEIEIRNGFIHAIQPKVSASVDSLVLNLKNRLILPGLINAHDHLEFGIFPRMGNGLYPDARSWAEDIYRPDQSPIRELLRIPKITRLFWGGLKNLFSGVTTVCHHSNYDAEAFDKNFPVRVVKDYGWSHSLDFSHDPRKGYEETPPHAPFLIHLGEGTTDKSRNEIYELDRLGLLNARTVLIHGVALEPAEWELLRERAAGVIWCPSSNLFTLGKTLSRQQVRSGIKVALGNDSPLTASGDLMDEIQSVLKLGFTPEEAYSLVTTSAAALLRLRKGEGQIIEGGVADLLIVGDTGSLPAQRLVSLSLNDIDLVLRQGEVVLASREAKRHLPAGVLPPLCPILCNHFEGWVSLDVKKHWVETARILGSSLQLAGKRLRI